ncbi:MAG: T9SS type A sorting domain-containing protein, partial [bacterium]
HIHSDDGSLSSTPYDLSTNNTCDGERAYRLVRVSGSSLQPRPTMEAGYSGQNLRVTWTPANDGNHDSVTAQVINNQNERFQHTLLKFVMPAGTTAVDVNGGNLTQSDLTGPVPVYYVTADVMDNSTKSVTVMVDATPVSGDDSDVPLGAWLGANVPNPFNPSTSLTLFLPSAGPMRLAVYDLQGRLVAPLADGQWSAGYHEFRWDGIGLDGQQAPSGVYFVNLQADGVHQSRKIILAK